MLHGIRTKWDGFRKKYERFIEDKGFFIVLATCVLVIVASAFFTFRTRHNDSSIVAEMETPPSFAASMDQSESLQQAQELVSSSQASETATKQMEFQKPLAGALGRAFSDQQPVYFPMEHCWKTHPAVDLLCEYGAIVSACSDGVVESITHDDWSGYVVVIQHEDGYSSRYVGLAEAPYLAAGDRVYAGQTIGHAGNEILGESDMGPHLHIEMLHDGVAINPIDLWLGVDKNNTL